MQKNVSSEEEFESSEKEGDYDDLGGGGPGGGGGGYGFGFGGPADSNNGPVGLATLRTPSTTLTGHTSVVICADWLNGGDQVITASW